MENMSRMEFFALARLCRVTVLLALFFSSPVYAQTTAKKAAEGAGTAEQRTAHAYEAARANPLDLHAFLARMPKGADLHYHLSGGIYAESLIRAAAEDGLCVDLASHSFVKPAGEMPPAPAQPDCRYGTVPAAKAFVDQNLYDTLINAFSMRSFVPSPGVSGHDHFFDTFGKFGGTSKKHAGEWLDEAASRAALQNEQYMELMETPDFSHAARIASEIGWRDDLSQFRTELLARGLREEIAEATAARDEAEASRRKIEHCGEPQETPACKITIRYIYQILRGFSKEQVFAQTLLGFETASADPSCKTIMKSQLFRWHNSMIGPLG
jgi:adenosine deaminase